MSSQPQQPNRKKRANEDVDHLAYNQMDNKRAKDEDISSDGSDDDLLDEDISSDGDYDDDDEDDSDIDKEISIDFSAYPAIDDDFNGIKTLLRQLWLKESLDISGLAQLLIDQSVICNVLKQEEPEEEADNDHKIDDEEDDDVYGLTSVIPLDSYSDKDCIKQLKTLLANYTPKDSQIHKLLATTDTTATKVGLILNERFSNLPPRISLASYDQLFHDLEDAKRDKQLPQLNLDFDWYLMVCKVLKPKTSAADASKTSANKSKTPSAEPTMTYVNAEEELFDECSDDRFEYSVASQCDSDVFDWDNVDNLLEPFRKLLLLSADSWRKAIDKLRQEFPNDKDPEDD